MDKTKVIQQDGKISNGHRYELAVALVIAGFSASPDVITDVLGLEPTEVRRVGDPYPYGTIIHKENSWWLESGASILDSNIEDHLISLQNLLTPVVERFSLLPKDVSIGLRCSLYRFDQSYFPIIHFSKKDLALLYAIGAEIDIIPII